MGDKAMANALASPNKRWRDDELAALKRLATEGTSAPELASLLGRSTGAVQQKALELGIRLVRVEKTSWWRGWPSRSPSPPDEAGAISGG